MPTTHIDQQADRSSKGMAKTISEQLENAGCFVERQASLGEAELLWVVDESGRRFHVTVKGRRS